ncbi:MAG: gamma-glutamyltransferase, partial [Verrucomicrobiales bacterium]
LRARIQMNRASEVEGHSTPEDADVSWFGKHTTHFTTTDEKGYWVACTSTINTSFGAKVVLPGTGIFLNNQMDDFSTAPGLTNFFGLLGGEANAVAPMKRPLSSMSPTVVLRRGKPLLTVGAAGGPTIISQAVLAIIGVVDFGLTVDQSLAEPRFHHQWRPDELRVESGFPASTLRELRRRGHPVVEVNSLGACQAIEQRQGAFRAAHDPRGEGRSLNW